MPDSLFCFPGCTDSGCRIDPRSCRTCNKVSQATAIFVKVTPTEINVIDYAKGYGHRDLVRVSGPS